MKSLWTKLVKYSLLRWWRHVHEAIAKPVKTKDLIKNKIKSTEPRWKEKLNLTFDLAETILKPFD